MAVKPPSGEERENECLLAAWEALNRIHDPSPRLRGVCVTIAKLLAARGVPTTQFARNITRNIKGNVPRKRA